LDPFKIQSKFKVDLFVNFIIKNLERFGSWAQNKNSSIWNFLSVCQVWKILNFGKMVFGSFKFEAFGSLSKIL
jgi:hypothetical protein